MAIDVEKTLGRIHEVNILLNSNVQDAVQSANESKAASDQFVKELDLFHKETKQKIEAAGKELAKQLLQLESNVKSEMMRTADITLQNAKSNYDALKEANNLLQKEHQFIIHKLNEQFEQNQAAIKVLGVSMDKHSNAILSTQNKMTEKLSMLNKALNDTSGQLRLHNETMLNKFEDQTKMMRKSQRKWFIWLIVLIIIGYFYEESMLYEAYNYIFR
ncbi:hypothetical protein [Paenibacillus agricola]|uniref:Uncharacterized protein n=1 Tax=Paenibacillus agricola TaxID=2716264 RepID=A0ABX0JKH3_9BACL|nr:hypothetical protein [Paenibacillus agricola]NHN34395.1 hypothetical protein [Paenibacillus agricola]